MSSIMLVWMVLVFCRNREPSIKEQLRAATDAVVARGAFGVPAMFVGDDLVWGQDRLHFVERLLQGETL